MRQLISSGSTVFAKLAFVVFGSLRVKTGPILRLILFVCLFLFNIPVNNFSVIWDGATTSWVFTSTLGTLKCLAQGHYTRLWGSNPGPLAQESETLPLSHSCSLRLICVFAICKAQIAGFITL